MFVETPRKFITENLFTTNVHNVPSKYLYLQRNRQQFSSMFKMLILNIYAPCTVPYIGFTFVYIHA